MRFRKRSLFFTLMLFLIIFGMSFASANENLTNENTNALSSISTDETQIDENINIEDTSIETLSASSSDDVDSNGSVSLTNEAQILRASNDEQVLGITVTGDSINDVLRAIRDAPEWSIIYLGNKTYHGEGFPWDPNANVADDVNI